MSQSTTRDDVQRNRELLAGLVLGDIDEQEQSKIDALVQSPRWRDELQQLEIAAAAVDIGWSKQFSTAVPGALRTRLYEAAESFLEDGEILDSKHEPAVGTCELRSHGTLLQETTASEVFSAAQFTHFPPSQRKTLGATREGLAWLVCVASLMTAVGLWWLSQPDRQLTREGLLALGSSTLRIDWQVLDESLDATGDVVWNQEEQTGFMRFAGLPINDSSVEQYQLWIIDESREVYPVDGGVFDIRENGEVTVPIRAALRVGKPKAFAVTIEKPGGVVVSDQSRLPLIAPVPDR